MEATRCSSRVNKGKPPVTYSPSPISPLFVDTPATNMSADLNNTIANAALSTSVPGADPYDSDQGSLTSIRSHHQQPEMPLLNDIDSADRSSTPMFQQEHHFQIEAKKRGMDKLMKYLEIASHRVSEMQRLAELALKERDTLEN